MPIVSSTYVQDGNRVVEAHADDVGKVVHVGPYTVPEGFDVAARVASRAVQINEQLAEAEAQALLNDGA